MYIMLYIYKKSNIFSYSSDGIDKEDIQFTNSDWLIFDQEYTEEKVKKLNFSEKLSLMFSNRKYFLDGMTCILPDTMKFIFEVNKHIFYNICIFYEIYIFI